MQYYIPRQPHAANEMAGTQHSAIGWGTDRAVARTPRARKGGTRRAGRAAFANFCRKGRMAHPTKTHRRWHRKTPLCLERTVTAMSGAATAIPAIAETRGHRCADVPMLRLVVADVISGFEKTKQAVELLSNFGLHEE